MWTWRKAESANTQNNFKWENVTFFTNLESVELFDKLHDIIAPIVRRRVRLPQENQERQQFVTAPKKMCR